jgi:hypothetical protein
LGPYSLAALYTGLVVSSLFVPSIMLKKLKCKATIVFSISGYAMYIAAQFYPTFATLIPAGVFLGVCAAPLWAAHALYIRFVEFYLVGICNLYSVNYTYSKHILLDYTNA